MTRIFSFSVLLIPFFCFGQQQYFNKRYDINQTSDLGFYILPYDTGYIAWISSSVQPNESRKVVEYFLGPGGNNNLTKIYGDTALANWTYLGGPGKIARTNDLGYALGGSLRTSVNEANVVLYRFDHFGDTVFVKFYGDSVFQSGWQCKQTRDGGFIITGQTLSSDPYGDVLLIKTDINGIMQWQKHYGGIDQELGYSVDTCLDGGYIIGGFTMSYGIHSLTDFPNTYLVKTDSLGNLEWEQHLGGYFYDAFWQVLQGSDGYIYAFGLYSVYDDSVNCCGGFDKPYAVKFDLAGNLLWEKLYGDSAFDTGILCAEEVANNEFILGGIITGSNQNHKGLIIRINNFGDSLFYNTYVNLHGAFSHSIFYDVSADIDNGYICTGFVSPLVPDTGTQDIWVLKLDSNGCEISNCLLSEITISQPVKPPFGIYPNPVTANSEITFTYSTLSEPGEIFIYNVDGKKVAAYSLPQWSSIQKVKLPKVAGGIYMANLVIGNLSANMKFVIQ